MADEKAKRKHDADYQRTVRAERRSKGICTRCGHSKARPGKTKCGGCSQKCVKLEKTRQEVVRESGKCIICGRKRGKYADYCDRCRKKRSDYAAEYYRTVLKPATKDNTTYPDANGQS